MSAKLPAFSVEQSNWLVTEVFENSDLLLKAFTQAHDNVRKRKKWEELATMANTKFGVGYFTDEKLKRRWETIQTQAKKRFDLEKQHRSGTGGGSHLKEPPTFIRFVIDHFGRKTGFTGISGGIDTSSSFTTDDLPDEAEPEIPQLSETGLQETRENNRHEGEDPPIPKKRKIEKTFLSTSNASSEYRDQLLQLEIRRSQLEIEKLEDERKMIAETRETLALWRDILKSFPQCSDASVSMIHLSSDPSNM